MKKLNSHSLIIDLMRHGAPVGGLRFRGKLDDPLTDEGFLQMQKTIDHFSKKPWSAIYSSPLKRCCAFAQHMSQQKNIKLIKAPQIQEIDFGQWEGKTSEQIYATDRVSLTQFWSDPVCFYPKGGEPLVVFKKRIESFMQTLIQKHQDDRILLVTHSGVIKMMLALALGLPMNNLYRLKIDFAHLAQLEYFYEGEVFLLKAFNTQRFSHE